MLAGLVAAACGRIGFDDRLARNDGATGDVQSAPSPSLWVVGGQLGANGSRTVYESADGVTWTDHGDRLPFELRNGSMVRFHDALYFMGGVNAPAMPNHTEVLRSPDGVTWTKVGDLPFSQESTIPFVYDDQIWLVGGEVLDGDPTTIESTVWRSADGITWVNADGSTATRAGSLPFPRDLAAGFVYAGRMWLVGGKHTSSGINDNVWQTIDGVHWYDADGNPASAAGNVPFGVWASSYAVFHDRMWVVGGEPSAVVADIAVSSDGITWSSPGAHDNPPRSFGSLVVAGDRMFLIGGTGPSGAEQSSVLASADGLTWAPVSSLPAPRTQLAAAAFAPRLENTRLGFTTGPQMVSSGGCSTAITVESRDDLGTPTDVTSDLVVKLYGFTSATGLPDATVFYADASCQAAVSSIVISAGTRSADLFFRAVGAGPHRIVAWAAGMDVAAQTATVQ